MYTILNIQSVLIFKKYIQLYIFNIHKILKIYTQFYKLNVHKFLIVCIQCTLFVKECIQLCIFDIYKFSKNVHNSISYKKSFLLPCKFGN